MQSIKHSSGLLVFENGDILNAKTQYKYKVQKEMGYCFIHFWGKDYRVHRLVAECFIPNPAGHPFVNHIDGDKSNNHYSNLEWCTHYHNMQHAHKTKLIDQKRVKALKLKALALLKYDFSVEDLVVILRLRDSIIKKNIE